ncbi:hypothetical protein RFI_29264 [Reticulomyxa filosa]|uniref:Mitochondrial import inner membrane translocase subunit TIM50 n=1 Tax=Reticulomyxa filosa TaxID=46433 RepID=X6M3A1_RETFI|nr:hypothetical protein RFI_29264 [Reticulomyxa filosa]|eukprot:ETO08126.1 hypothetical protein RFI_29264 [Reticulomyxa filosa]
MNNKIDQHKRRYQNSQKNKRDQKNDGKNPKDARIDKKDSDNEKEITNSSGKVDVLLDGRIRSACVKQRPFLQGFLDGCSKYYDIMIFTAAGAKYADDVLKLIDKNHYITRRLYNDSLTLDAESGFYKDITKLGRSMNDVVFVDDRKISCSKFPSNSICIDAYEGADNDTAVIYIYFVYEVLCLFILCKVYLYIVFVYLCIEYRNINNNQQNIFHILNEYNRSWNNIIMTASGSKTTATGADNEAKAGGSH